MKTILFLCTGNYYRSRFAEQYFNAIAEKLNLEWKALSRGLSLERGIHNIGPISQDSLAYLSELGIEGDNSRFPIQLEKDTIIKADIIIAIKETEHRKMLAEKYPGWEEKAVYWHVHDLDEEPADTALPQLKAKVDHLIHQIS